MNIFLAAISGNRAVLDEEESWHCSRVLRKRVGEQIRLIDGKGFFYNAKLEMISDKRCEAVIDGDAVPQERRNYRLHLAIAPTKQVDRIEWMVEKAVEIGVDEFSFILCGRSERAVLKTDRVRKIVLSAVKQSLQAKTPVINELINFHAFVTGVDDSQKFIGWCGEGDKVDLRAQKFASRSSLVLIGPEGDFTEEEIALAHRHGYVNLSLGSNRLRTETAALAVAMAAAVL